MEQHGAWGSRSRDGLHDKTPEKHEFDMNRRIEETQKNP